MSACLELNVFAEESGQVNEIKDGSSISCHLLKSDLKNAAQQLVWNRLCNIYLFFWCEKNNPLTQLPSTIVMSSAPFGPPLAGNNFSD